METKSQLLNRFRSHANLPGYEQAYIGLGMVLHDRRRSKVRPELAPHIRELIRLLQCVMSARGTAAAALSQEEERVVSYAMSVILSDLAQELVRDEVQSEEAWRGNVTWALAVLAYAWTSVVAGDVDDILSEVEAAGLFDNSCWIRRSLDPVIFGG